MAHEVGSLKASNMIMLGASVPFLSIPESSIEKGIQSIFESKGKDVVELNLKAMHSGKEYARLGR
jgi:indolepyruvate ferredoxin oxidoreductase beta subunit